MNLGELAKRVYELRVDFGEDMPVCLNASYDRRCDFEINVDEDPTLKTEDNPRGHVIEINEV